MTFQIFVALMGVLALFWGILEAEARLRPTEAEQSVKEFKRHLEGLAKATRR